jgi:hypothetical protein
VCVCVCVYKAINTLAILHKTTETNPCLLPSDRVAGSEASSDVTVFTLFFQLSYLIFTPFAFHRPLDCLAVLINANVRISQTFCLTLFISV